MKYLRKISLVMVCFASLVFADNWAKLKSQADKLYSDWDIAVEVSLGYEDDKTTTGKAEVKIPLYSKEKRVGKAEKKIKYLEDGAGLLKKINQAKEKTKILKSKADILKALMKEKGIEGVTAYYDVMMVISDIQAEKIEAERKLEAMLR